MLVIDTLRKLRDKKVYVPPFHLGHLGFIPGLEVNCRHERLDDRYGQELTLTPFQGSRDQLFLLKCVFRDRPGVVSAALTALAALQLNVLSFESATIDGGKKHVLFCILSWTTSEYQHPIPLDEGTRHKFIEVLPLLPIADWRYLLLLQVIFLFCGEALDYEELEFPGRPKLRLPKIHLRLFDAFQEAQGNWVPLKVQVERHTSTAGSLAPSVYFDLKQVIGNFDSVREVIPLSETETKTLRLIFPGAKREGKLLHIAFVHLNKPGALVALSWLVRQCGFNIITSLLRKFDQNTNVWEVMLELVGTTSTRQKRALPIPRGSEGVAWFREWCFGRENRTIYKTEQLIRYMVGYRVGICRPSYPRSRNDDDKEFLPTDIVDGNDTPISGAVDYVRIGSEQFDRALKELHTLASGGGAWAWLAVLTCSELRRRLVHLGHNGTVFLSLPTYCNLHHDLIKEALEKNLGVEVHSYIKQNSKDVCETALSMIRDADYFFALWHPDRNRPGDVSPWMPFEYGAARALGKPKTMIFHASISEDVKRRIDPGTSWVEYEDLTFTTKLDEVVEHCRTNWFTGPAADLKIEVES